MTAASGKKVIVSGFSGSSVQVIDITNPSSVSLVPGTVSSGTVAFVPSREEERGRFWPWQARSLPVRQASWRIAGSSWHSAQAGADMVIISYGDFIDSLALAPLVALRQSQGLRVAVVDVEDLYDEFNFGVESPYAIRSFLSAVKANWSTKQAYVLLMGNGTFDPRNYLGDHGARSGARQAGGHQSARDRLGRLVCGLQQRRDSGDGHRTVAGPNGRPGRCDGEQDRGLRTGQSRGLEG